MRGGSGCARGAAKSDQRGRPHHHHLAGSLLPSCRERRRAGEGRGAPRLAAPHPAPPWGRSGGSSISHGEGEREKSPPWASVSFLWNGEELFPDPEFTCPVPREVDEAAGLDRGRTSPPERRGADPRARAAEIGLEARHSME